MVIDIFTPEFSCNSQCLLPTADDDNWTVQVPLLCFFNDNRYSMKKKKSEFEERKLCTIWNANRLILEPRGGGILMLGVVCCDCCGSFSFHIFDEYLSLIYFQGKPLK